MHRRNIVIRILLLLVFFGLFYMFIAPYYYQGSMLDGLEHRAVGKIEFLIEPLKKQDFTGQTMMFRQKERIMDEQKYQFLEKQNLESTMPKKVKYHQIQVKVTPDFSKLPFQEQQINSIYILIQKANDVEKNILVGNYDRQTGTILGSDGQPLPLLIKTSLYTLKRDQNITYNMTFHLNDGKDYYYHGKVGYQFYRKKFPNT